MQMYLYSLGEFDLDAAVARREKIGWLMFVLASFALNVIFMNMIIAIISETFENMQEKAEENSLYERVNLMKNMFWLLDLKEIYGNNKYIVYVHIDDVCPEGELNEEEINWEQELDKRFVEVANKMHNNEEIIVKKVHEFDKSSKDMMTSIYSS